MSERFMLGVDIGGTNLEAGLLTEAGELVERAAAPVEERDKSEEGLLDAVARLARSLWERRGVDADARLGVGCGAAGVIDTARGIVTQAPNFPAWRDFAFVERLSARLGCPVAVENDVNAIARGEAWRGACRGVEHFVALALGTGVGGALVLHGEVWDGVDGMAGEMGHVNVFPDGAPCGCGARGCLETEASSSGLIRKVRERGFARAEQRAGRPSQIARALAEMAREGDREAQVYWDEMGFALGLALAGLLNSLNVKIVLIGGGIGRALDLFQPRMEETLRAYAFPAVARGVEWRVSALWEAAGIYGAAANLLRVRGA